MAARRFGARVVNVGTEEILMSGQAGYDSTVVVNIANQGTASTNVFVAYMNSTDLNDLSTEDYLVYNKPLGPGQHIEFKGIAVEEGHSIVVRTDNQPVSAIVYGFENVQL